MSVSARSSPPPVAAIQTRPSASRRGAVTATPSRWSVTSATSAGTRRTCGTSDQGSRPASRCAPAGTRVAGREVPVTTARSPSTVTSSGHSPSPPGSATDPAESRQTSSVKCPPSARTSSVRRIGHPHSCAEPMRVHVRRSTSLPSAQPIHGCSAVGTVTDSGTVISGAAMSLACAGSGACARADGAVTPRASALTSEVARRRTRRLFTSALQGRARNVREFHGVPEGQVARFATCNFWVSSPRLTLQQPRRRLGACRQQSC